MPLSVFSDESFMREALKEAQSAFEDGEVPVGAVIVCQNRIIARAHNLTERLKDTYRPPITSRGQVRNCWCSTHLVIIN